MIHHSVKNKGASRQYSLLEFVNERNIIFALLNIQNHKSYTSVDSKINTAKLSLFGLENHYKSNSTQI